MKIRATIDFEVDDKLIRQADYNSYNCNSATPSEKVNIARAQIQHQLVVDLTRVETCEHIGQIHNETSIVDYKFTIVTADQLIFTM